MARNPRVSLDLDTPVTGEQYDAILQATGIAPTLSVEVHDDGTTITDETIPNILSTAISSRLYAEDEESDRAFFIEDTLDTREYQDSVMSWPFDVRAFILRWANRVSGSEYDNGSRWVYYDPSEKDLDEPLNAYPALLTVFDVEPDEAHNLFKDENAG